MIWNEERAAPLIDALRDAGLLEWPSVAEFQRRIIFAPHPYSPRWKCESRRGEGPWYDSGWAATAVYSDHEAACILRDAARRWLTMSGYDVCCYAVAENRKNSVVLEDMPDGSSGTVGHSSDYDTALVEAGLAVLKGGDDGES